MLSYCNEKIIDFKENHITNTSNPIKNFLNTVISQFDNLPKKFIDDIYYNQKYPTSPKNWSWDHNTNTLRVTGKRQNYSGYVFTINKPFEISKEDL